MKRIEILMSIFFKTDQIFREKRLFTWVKYNAQLLVTVGKVIQGGGARSSPSTVSLNASLRA